MKMPIMSNVFMNNINMLSAKMDVLFTIFIKIEIFFRKRAPLYRGFLENILKK
jgi:hypothetical protein